MEGLTRLVSESLARHGFDRPLDYRRLQWSRWFRCDSHHSLLFVPSKPGVFALAEEIIDLAPAHLDWTASGSPAPSTPAGEGHTPRRMLAVAQFFEADDMAFALERMLSLQNPMRARLESGRYFVRFVAIEDLSQRRTIASALNQWILSSSAKATGIGSHFASSLELTPATEYVARETSPATDSQAGPSVFSFTADLMRKTTQESVVRQAATSPAASHLDSGAAANIHCPSPLPSGF